MRGRCAGCGWEDPSSKRVRVHVQECGEYLALFRATPERALDPEAEYVRDREHRQSAEFAEADEARRAAVHEGFRVAQARRVASDKNRWKTGRLGPERQVSAPVGVPAPGGAPTLTGEVLLRMFVNGDVDV